MIELQHTKCWGYLDMDMVIFTWSTDQKPVLGHEILIIFYTHVVSYFIDKPCSGGNTVGANCSHGLTILLLYLKFNEKYFYVIPYLVINSI